jgi:hypothetical protein
LDDRGLSAADHPYVPALTRLSIDRYTGFLAQIE